MNANNKSNYNDTEKLKEIPKWTRRYTQNRTLPFIASMVIFLLLFAGIFLSSYFSAKAMKTENLFLFCVSMLIMIIALVATIILSFPKGGANFAEKLNLQFYRKEGQVKLSTPQSTKTERRISRITAFIFGACVPTTVLLGFWGYIPIKYMQPVSVIYVVPFLISIRILQRQTPSPAGFVWWLWPILYTIHAILIVAGVPILFSERLEPLNMLIPIAGYGILCALIGHLYSRYALRKLKGIAGFEGGGADGA
jgi:hypothetical protein